MINMLIVVAVFSSDIVLFICILNRFGDFHNIPALALFTINVVIAYLFMVMSEDNKFIAEQFKSFEQDISALSERAASLGSILGDIKESDDNNGKQGD